jgi:hypothetical protein
VDVVIRVLIGVGIFGGALWVVRLLANPPPPESEEVQDVAIEYRCGVCGMQLTVTQARGSGAKPPRHCMEDMEPAG